MTNTAAAATVDISTVDAAGNILCDVYIGRPGPRADQLIADCQRAANDPASAVAAVRVVTR